MKTCWLLILTLTFTACSNLQTSEVQHSLNESDRFSQYLESVYQRRLADEPELASSLGSKLNYDSWNDRSTKAIEQKVKQNWLDLRTLHSSFDYQQLDSAQQLNYQVYEAGLKLRIKRHAWRHHISPVNQIVGLHLQIPGLLTKAHSIDRLDDAHAYIRRVQTVNQPISQFIEQLQAREQAGFLLAKSLLPRLIQASESVISGTLEGDDDNNLILADFKKKISKLELGKDHKQKLSAQLSTALSNSLFPAYEELIAAFRQQQQKEVSDKGVWHYPDGAQFYQFLLEQFTTTSITADELHQLGLNEVERIHEEMQAIKNEVGFSGDLQDFFTHLKTAPQFYFENTDQGRQAYMTLAQGILNRAIEQVSSILPEAMQHPVRIKRIEAYREKSAPVGFYEAGSADGSTPGTVYLGMYDMSSAAKYDLNALLSHEGVPGHHLQLSVMHSQKHIPNTRKYYVWWSNTAFTEGWALYAETLAEEMGLYGDAYTRFGRLAGDLWRACRLVVDSGLHSKKWSRQKAIDYLNNNTASSLENNERAIDRYIAVPGQATAFKIGMIKIQELRKRAREQLGDKFDIRGFHYTVLKNGPIPLSLIEKEVQTWVNETLAL